MRPLRVAFIRNSMYIHHLSGAGHPAVGLRLFIGLLLWGVWSDGGCLLCCGWWVGWNWRPLGDCGGAGVASASSGAAVPAALSMSCSGPPFGGSPHGVGEWWGWACSWLWWWSRSWLTWGGGCGGGALAEVVSPYVRGYIYDFRLACLLCLVIYIYT